MATKPLMLLGALYTEWTNDHCWWRDRIRYVLQSLTLRSEWTNGHCWWRDRIRYVLKERVDKRPLLVERQNQVCVERVSGQTTTAGGETESGMCWKSEWTNDHCWWRDRIRYVLKEWVDKRPLLVERQNQVCVERASGQTTTAGGATESGMCWKSEWTNDHCWWSDRIRYVLKERVDKRPLLVERQNQVRVAITYRNLGSHYNKNCKETIYFVCIDLLKRTNFIKNLQDNHNLCTINVVSYIHCTFRE